MAFIDFSGAPATWSTRFCRANPADLPVERAAKFDLVVSLIVAKAIGLDMPADTAGAVIDSIDSDAYNRMLQPRCLR